MIDGHLPEPPLIVERPRQAFGFAETAEDPLEFSERKECSSQVEAKIDGLLQRLAGLGQMPEGRQRLLEAAHRLPVGRSRQCLGAGLTEVRDRLLPQLAPHGMVGQPLDVLGQPVRIAAFDGADDPGVQGLAPVLEQGAVGDFMGERVLEGVLGIRKEARLVQKLGRLQMREPPLHRILRRLRHGVEQHEGHVLADDRGRLEQLLVVRREPVDPGRQDHLHRRRDLDRLDRPGQTIGAALPGERPRLHQRPDALLDEEGVPALDQQPLEGLQRRVVAQEGAQQLARALGRERVEPQLAVVGLAAPSHAGTRAGS